MAMFDDAMACQSEMMESVSARPSDVKRKKQAPRKRLAERKESAPRFLGSSAKSVASDDSDGDEDDCEMEESNSVVSKATPALSPDVLCERIVALQSFDGSFALTVELAALLGFTIDAVKAAAGELGAAGETMMATALVVAFFRSKLAALKAEWVLVEAKALKWLTKIATAASSDSEAVLGRATAVLASA